jgi:hypothetical protein
MAKKKPKLTENEKVRLKWTTIAVFELMPKCTVAKLLKTLQDGSAVLNVVGRNVRVKENIIATIKDGEEYQDFDAVSD